MGEVQFGCAACGAAITKPLCHLRDTDLLRDQVGEDCYNNPPSLVPQGFYVTSDEVLSAGKMWPEFAPTGELVFNSKDLITHPTLLNEDDVGCCGYTGGSGLNVFCANGHAVGIEVSDCCVVNFVHIPQDTIHKTEKLVAAPRSE